ncbi:hypothetical protein RZO50_02390 [Microbacterium sp. SSW1-59]|uniref:hypothetical protein n=1 Tax=Microbacterium xanthum TaxID=3079794 RepID=UPI002AD52CE1|nr:hypothetical protein [Microbacterium sp. SSW1-59]MDZ8200345.1 hypothetical protein [Microbacterium sp. SSW1-59]
MPLDATSSRPPHRWTLLGVMTVAGDLIVISITLLILWAGLLTAGPGSTAAMRARRRVSQDAPSHPFRNMLADTRRDFRKQWSYGPIIALIGASSWISTAFWLVAPAPFGVIMMAVVLALAAVAALVTLALPTASARTNGFRAAIVDAARLVAFRPFVSIVALAAAVAAGILCVWIPTVGVVAAGMALVEIAWRAWGKAALGPA